MCRIMDVVAEPTWYLMPHIVHVATLLLGDLSKNFHAAERFISVFFFCSRFNDVSDRAHPL